MSTTVSSASVELSRRLADEVSAAATDGERFTSAQRTAALNAAVKQVVLYIMGAANTRRSAYQLLGDLVFRDAQSIGANGLALSSLTYQAAGGGVLDVECDINGAKVFGVERAPEDLQHASNPHFQGNDGRPIYYVRGVTLFLEVSLGSYPVTSYVHYVAHPKELHLTTDDSTYTNALQTSPSLDEVIYSAAIVAAQQMSDDYDKVNVVNESVKALLGGIISHEFGKSNKRRKGDA